MTNTVCSTFRGDNCFSGAKNYRISIKSHERSCRLDYFLNKNMVLEQSRFHIIYN